MTRNSGKSRTAKIDVREAVISVSINGDTKAFRIEDINFSDSRKDIAMTIGGTIIDHIYASTEGKRSVK